MRKTAGVLKKQPSVWTAVATAVRSNACVPDHFQDVLKMTRRERRLKLGQVFTEEAVADFMARECLVTPQDRGLDPCFGEGQLLVAVAAQLARLGPCGQVPDYAKQLSGIEIDPDLFSVGYQRLVSHVNGSQLPGLCMGDFFQLEPPPQLFDFVIMNPPYVRQEHLDKRLVAHGSTYDANTVLDSTGRTDSRLPGRSNLYSYFFAGIARFLRPGGRLVAITYDSWLFTRFGETLQAMFLRDYSLLKVIKLSGSAFDKASIGTCIVVLEKKSANDEANVSNGGVSFVRAEVKRTSSGTASTPAQKVVRVEGAEEISKSDLSASRRWDVFFRYPPFHAQLMRTARWTRLDSCCIVKRGAEPLSVNFFVRDASAWKSLGVSNRWLTPVIKDPALLEQMDTAGRPSNERYLCLESTKQELLARPGGPAVVRYLQRVEQELLLTPGKYRGLARAVKDAPDSWFVHSAPDVPDVFFSYIMRRRKIFWFNDGRIPTTDNFANLFARVSPLALFAALNGTFVRYQIEVNARRQGSGLSKLQVFELAALPIPDLLEAPATLVVALEDAGKCLAEMPATVEGSASKSALVANIDQALWRYMGVDGKTARAIAISERQLTLDRLTSDSAEA
jgi:hypothetical protein